MNAHYTRDDASGISKDHRELLSRLHRENSVPFNIDDATTTLGLPRPKVRSLLRYWCARGWLSRMKRGIYITVPLNARNPSGFFCGLRFCQFTNDEKFFFFRKLPEFRKLNIYRP